MRPRETPSFFFLLRFIGGEFLYASKYGTVRRVWRCNLEYKAAKYLATPKHWQIHNFWQFPVGCQLHLVGKVKRWSRDETRDNLKEDFDFFIYSPVITSFSGITVHGFYSYAYRHTYMHICIQSTAVFLTFQFLQNISHWQTAPASRLVT